MNERLYGDAEDFLKADQIRSLVLYLFCYGRCSFLEVGLEYPVKQVGHYAGDLRRVSHLLDRKQLIEICTDVEVLRHHCDVPEEKRGWSPAGTWNDKRKKIPRTRTEVRFMASLT